MQWLCELWGKISFLNDRLVWDEPCKHGRQAWGGMVQEMGHRKVQGIHGRQGLEMGDMEEKGCDGKGQELDGKELQLDGKEQELDGKELVQQLP